MYETMSCRSTMSCKRCEVSWILKMLTENWIACFIAEIGVDAAEKKPPKVVKGWKRVRNELVET